MSYLSSYIRYCKFFFRFHLSLNSSFKIDIKKWYDSKVYNLSMNNVRNCDVIF